MVIVEGGVDALAVVDRARAAGRSVGNPVIPSVIVTGGVGVRRWLENPAVKCLLKEARSVVLWGENEKDQLTQIRSDQERNRLTDCIVKITSGEVLVKMPEPSLKDVAEQNICEKNMVDKQINIDYNEGLSLKLSEKSESLLDDISGDGVEFDSTLRPF